MSRESLEMNDGHTDQSKEDTLCGQRFSGRVILHKIFIFILHLTSVFSHRPYWSRLLHEPFPLRTR